MTTPRPGELFRTTPDTGWKESDNSGFILTGGRSLEAVLKAIKAEGTGGGEEKIQQDDAQENTAKDEEEKAVDKMAEVEEEDTEEGLTTREVLDMAQVCLEELNLVEAERLFLKAYRKLQSNPEENYRSRIEIYIGMSEMCTRKSRTSRQSPLEWQWLCVHATTLLQETIEMCSTEIDLEHDNQWMDWYQSKREWAVNRTRGLEDVLARTVHNWLRENWRVVDPYHTQNVMGSLTPTTASKFPLSTLLGLGIKPYQSGYLTQSFSVESLHEAPISEAMTVGNANWFRRLQLYCKRRLYDRNINSVLEEVLQFRGPLSDKGSSSQRLSTDTLTDGSDADFSDSMDVESEIKKDVVKEYSLGDELAASDVDTSGWDFFLEKRKNCEIGSILQLASDSESGDLSGAAFQEALLSKPQLPEKKDFVSPLLEQPIRLVIAKVFHKVVAKLLQEDEFQKAEMLCEEILQIVDDIQDGTVRLLRFSAQLLQNIGILCLRQGDVSKGMIHLEKALQIFRDLQEYDAHREVALVLIDLGNAHIATVLSEDSLHKYIIAAMSEFFEKEYSDESESGDSSPESKRSTEDLLGPEGRSSIDEAITCYTEALMVLENNDEANVENVAKALLKLGDCHFVLKNYTDSLDAYEKSMNYFRVSRVHGKESLMHNAHVLCMLGVSTFMLHVYPRAASVFELAYRMVRQAHFSHKIDSETFFHGLLHSLLGICYYKMKAYHKCVSMCYQAFELFWNMFGEKIPDLPKEKFWLVCQNLYILGNSYNVLNLQHKAIKYLNIGRALMLESKNGEKRQCMRILQILGDCYFAQYDYKTALVYYNEALDFGNHEDPQQSEEASVLEPSPQTDSDDMALHNQLLSRSADAHISMNQYQNAVHYLEQARDIQDVLGEDIKGDLVSTLYQLGQMHSFAGDVDKAIESYKESIEIGRELHDGEVGPEMCTMLGNLATMCYVKACICESIDQELELILKAEQYFQDAIAIRMLQSVCVKYANFLYSQGNYDDAILYLEDALKAKENTGDIVFGGLEKVTLPEPLQDEVDAQEEVVMPSACLGKYILALSNTMLGKPIEAEKWVISLMEDVYTSDIPFLWSVLGYAMMELGLFEEAAINFAMAASLDAEYNLAIDNHCMCLCILTLTTIHRALASIFIYNKMWYEDARLPELEEGKGY